MAKIIIAIYLTMALIKLLFGISFESQIRARNRWAREFYEFDDWDETPWLWIVIVSLFFPLDIIVYYIGLIEYMFNEK